MADAPTSTAWPTRRRGDRHRRAHLAGHRQAGQLARTDRRTLRHPSHLDAFPIGGLRTTIAGTVDFVPVDEISAPALSERMAELVIEEAVSEAGIGDAVATSRADVPRPAAGGTGVAAAAGARRLGANAAAANEAVTYDDLLRAAATGKFARYYERFLFGSVAENLAVRFGTKGSPVATSTACASGATAIQLGVEAIRRGEAEAALVVGTDASVNPESLIRFSLLSALSTRNDPPEAAARPFSKDRDGFVMAEGAGALVLESLAHASARGAQDPRRGRRLRRDGGRLPPHALLAGRQADHRLHAATRWTTPGCAPDAIGYINAHGTGTPENDKMEWVGVSTVFGERASSIPISSNKSMIGHTLTAAGAVEAIFTLLTLQHGRLPPTINYETPDPALPVDCVPNVARDAQVTHAISNSFGFGGQNVCLVMGLP